MPGRSNGLQALAYAPLTELDPRLVDSVLAALRGAHIAAYVVAAGPAARPRDRLWVDATAVDRARQVVDLIVPAGDPAPLDEDAAWREIIAHFEQGPTTPVPPWPVTEDVDDSGAGRVLRRVEPAPPVDTPVDTPVERAASDDTAHAPHGAPDDGPHGAPQNAPDADHFEPPPPPPLPRPTPAVFWAWVALIGGIGVLLTPLVLGWSLDGWLAVIGVAGLVGGFVGLVARLGDEPRDDDGPDDGAVI